MISTLQTRFLKRVGLLVAGLFVLLYCLAVFLYVASQPTLPFQIAGGPTTPFQVLNGSMVVSVEPTGALQQKVVAGDRIDSIDDRKIDSPFHLALVLQEMSAPTIVRVTVFHDDGKTAETFDVEVTRTPFPVRLLLWLLCAAVIGATGFIFHYRRSEDNPTALFYIMCLLFSTVVMGAFSWHVIIGEPGLLTVFVIAGAMLPPVTLHFFFVYPQTNPILKKAPFFSAVIYLPALVYLVFMLILIVRLFGIGVPDTAEAGETTFRALHTVRLLVIYQFGALFAYFAAALVSLWYCQRTTLHTDVKNQIKWVWWGVVTAVIPAVMVVMLAAEGFRQNAFGHIQFWAMLAMLAVLVATGLSLLKYRLMYIDTFLNRSLGYIVVTLIVLLLYLGAVGIVSWILRTVQGEVTHIPWIISVLAIAAFFRPVSDGVQKVIDKKFYRERYEFQQAVYETSQAIGRILDLDLLLRELMNTIMDSLHVKRGAVLLWDAEKEHAKVAVARGYLEPDSQLTLTPEDVLFQEIKKTQKPVITRELHEINWKNGEYAQIIARMVKMHAEAVIPITGEDGLLGLFILGRKRSRQIYSSEDVRLLMTLANHAAIAIHNASTYTQMEMLNEELKGKITTISEQGHEILGLQQQLLSENVYLKEEIEEKYNFQDIIGTSDCIQEVIETVKKVAPSMSAVLIRGDSGTGKELFARAIHYNSPRRDKPFIRMNCAVLTESLLESELFGHEKGAFTGAVADRPGRFEVAEGGTIFLDEIGDVTPRTQVKLLRVLQEKEFERVGSNETRTADVRVIAATNRDLEELMKRGKFRDDLFYRLNVISIRVPPLRERKEDIFPLAVHFLNKCARAAGKAIRSMDPEVLSLMKRYRWPGNVRELENLVERAVVLADGSTLTVADFPIEIDEYEEEEIEGDNGLNRQLDTLERDSLKKALRAANGNKSRAARELGLARSTFISKLKKWGLD